MNIAIFTPNQNPYSETFIQAHKNYLKGTVFYYYGNKNIQLEGYPPIISLWKRRGLRLIQKLRQKPSSFVRDKIVLRSLKQYKIESILVEYGTHAHRLLPVFKKAKIPFVVHFHGYDASIRKIVEQHQNYTEVFKAAAFVIAVSKKMESMLLNLGCPREKLIYNVYGLQPEFMEVQPSFAKKQFIAIGRFTDKKAPYYTLLAFKKVVEKHPEAHMLMAGNGQLLNMCINLSKYLNIEKQVEFLGVITPEKYRELLIESLAFVQHSITAENGDMEGTPLSVLEASAAGLPVVSTYHAGIPDVIIDGKTGLLCNEHDVGLMATNMINLIENVNFAKKLGEAGKNNISANYSLERHIKLLQDCLENFKK